VPERRPMGCIGPCFEKHTKRELNNRHPTDPYEKCVVALSQRRVQREGQRALFSAEVAQMLRVLSEVIENTFRLNRANEPTKTQDSAI